MKVILDTNALLGHVRFSGPTFMAFEDILRQGRHTLCLSEVVLAELRNKFCERLSEALREIEKSNRNLESLVDERLPSPAEEEYKREQIAKYDLRLDDLVARTCAVVHPYPDVSHKEIVDRDLARRRPFNKDGRGYRDYLIWLTVLEAAKAGEQVALITDDGSGFLAEGRGQPSLHSDLIADLEELGFPKESVLVFRSMKSFVEARPSVAAHAGGTAEHVDATEGSERGTDNDRLAVSEMALLEQLRGRSEGTLDLDDVLREHLPKALEGIEQESRDLGLPESIETLTITAVDEISHVNARQLHVLASGEVWVSGSCVVACSVDGFIFKGDIYELDDRQDLDITVDDWDWNDHYATVIGTATARVTFTFLFSPKPAQVHSFEVETIEGTGPDSQRSYHAPEHWELNGRATDL